MPTTATKEHAHELIERLPSSQLMAVVGLLEAMLDPVFRAVAQAAADDDRRKKNDKPWPRPRNGFRTMREFRSITFCLISGSPRTT